MIQDIKIAEEFKKILKEPMGSLISEKDLKDDTQVITVGDRATLTVLEHGITPVLAVVDYKEKRKAIPANDRKTLEKFGEIVHRAKNNAGFVSVDAWNAVRESLSTNSTVRLEIEGEEDLLTLAVLFQAPHNSCIIYGQPGKGLVLIEATPQKKQEYAELLIETSARAFMQWFSGKTVIAYDGDADGCCSAALLAKYVQEHGLEVVPIVTNDAVLHDEVVKKIKKLKVGNLLVVDFGGEAAGILAELSKSMNVLVIDHHRMHAKNFGKTLVLNPHIFSIPEQWIAPTSWLAYRTARTEDWKAAVGIIGDKGFLQCKEFLKGVKAKYSVDFDKLTDMVNSAFSVRKPEEAVSALLSAKTPEELLKSKKLLSFEKKISEEVERILKAHKKKALFKKNLIIYDFKSKYAIRGTISNQMQQAYKGQVVVIGEEEGKYYFMSMRTTNRSIDLVPLIKKSMKGFEEARGGGHAQACGCKVLLRDKKRFLGIFTKNLCNT